MSPTLLGRIQTRIFVLVVIGGLWTLIITPGVPMSVPLGDRYKATYGILAIITVLGIGWEFIYHFLQQWRWEKDWPTLYGLLQGIPEGIVAYFVAHAGVISWTKGVSASAFVVAFATTWIVTWVWVNGPMRVVSIYWRFRGGRLL